MRLCTPSGRSARSLGLAALLVALPIGHLAIRLNPPLPSDRIVVSFSVSPDGLQAVYLSDQETNNVFELYAVTPLDGTGIPRRLNGPEVGDEDVIEYRISPDSSRVAYTVKESTELYSVSLDGSSAPTRLTGPLPPWTTISLNAISSDSTRVVYLSDHSDVAFFDEIYSVPIDGSSAPIRLSGPRVAGGELFDIGQVSPDSSRVVYVADQDTDEAFELYSAPIDGSSPAVRLNGPLGADGDVFPNFFGYFPFLTVEISADSSRVVYGANQDMSGVEVYSAPIDGSATPVKLSAPMVANGRPVFLRISADSSRVVYGADQDVNEVMELYSVPIDGSEAPVKLNGPLAPGAECGMCAISPDSTHVVFILADFSMAGIQSAPIDGSSPPVQIADSIQYDGPPFGVLQISGDSSRVVYWNADTLYSVPIAGGTAVNLSGNLTVSDVPWSFESDYPWRWKIDPQSRRVFFSTRNCSCSVGTLYAVPIDGSRSPMIVDEQVFVGETSITPMPDGKRLLYRAARPNTWELFMTYLTPAYRRASAPVSPR